MGFILPEIRVLVYILNESSRNFSLLFFLSCHAVRPHNHTRVCSFTDEPVARVETWMRLHRHVVFGPHNIFKNEELQMKL